MKINSSILFAFCYLLVSIQVLSLLAPIPTKTLSGHTNWVNSVAFSPDGI